MVPTPWTAAAAAPTIRAMDPTFLMGSGIVILGFFVWLFCAYLAYQTAPKFHRRPLTWGILGVIFGPFALFALYLLPKGHVETHHDPAHHDKKADSQAALYEVPKKKHH
jgi:hypothetical protein